MLKLLVARDYVLRFLRLTTSRRSGRMFISKLILALVLLLVLAAMSIWSWFFP